MPTSPSPTTEPLEVVSPRGVQTVLHIRLGTNDAATLHSTFRFVGSLHDEYGLAALHTDGWVLDIGAHIGSVALAVALDNPLARVVAVEAVPENADLLERNAELAGVRDRLFVVAKAADREGAVEATIRYGPYDVPGVPADHAEESRFIGNLYRDHGDRGVSHVIPSVSLTGLLDAFGIDRVAFMKIDCEGCEWPFLASPSIARVDLIVGEYHDRGFAAIEELLSPTHVVECLHDDGGFGLFRAIAR